MTPKVTVLLAVHDGEPFIRQCVDSVLAQTFEDFEFLIVDDASRDATPTILASYNDPRIRVLRKADNQGQVASLNGGLHEARGVYVARIDADDWCRPERLERQVAVLDERPEVGLVGTWMDLVDDRDRRVARLRATISDFAEFVFQTLIMRVLISHPSAMYRRAPVIAAGGYDGSTGPAEDKDLWRRLLLERWGACIVPESLVVYRVHDGQLSQVHAEDQQAVDGASQERFLAALEPTAAVRPLRLLLANDPGLWNEPRTAGAADLSALLDAAAGRLRLDEAEAARVRRLVAARVLLVARTRPWRPEARALTAYALAQLPREQRRGGAGAYAAAFAVAPVRIATRRSAKTVSRTAAHIPGLRALRAPVRRSRMARVLYGKLMGSS
jgi:cellulose synthase/poly-beta-1,6-N-acetylglucosamine synthase-like glycosyltransferase